MSKTRISFIILIIISLIALGMSALKKPDYSDVTALCDQKILTFLKINNVDIENPLFQETKPVSGFWKKAVCWKKEFRLPYSVSAEQLKKDLADSIDFSPAIISSIKKTKTSKENIITLELTCNKLKIYYLILRQKHIKGKIAIVLDDWGYSDIVLAPAIALKTPITYAILPNLAYSQKTAEILNANGDELILHLPLEPHNAANLPLEKNTILTNMDKQEIIDITLNNLESLPDLKGVNNHMGSKATEDKNVMGIIFDIIKEKNLYFLDSYTSRQSVLTPTAEEKNIAFFKRDIFLDDINDKENIRKQLLKTKDIAEKTGTAIAIGHAKTLTIETLSEMIPVLEEQGFKFVYLSDLNSAQEDK